MRTFAPLCLCAFVPLCLSSPAPAHPGLGILAMPDDCVYFVDSMRARIYKIDAKHRLTLVYDDKGRDFLRVIHHLAQQPDGHFFAASDDGRRVWLIQNDGEISAHYPGQDGPGLGIIGFGGDPFTIDTHGNLYCVNARQGRVSQIIRITRSGVISVHAGTRWGDDDGKGDQARFRDLHGSAIVVAAEDALVLTDNGTRVRRISAEGVVTTLAGGPIPGFADGKGSHARFQGAAGLTLDPRGNVYVADADNRAIRMIAPDGTVSTLARNPKLSELVLRNREWRAGKWPTGIPREGTTQPAARRDENAASRPAEGPAPPRAGAASRPVIDPTTPASRPAASETDRPASATGQPDAIPPAPNAPFETPVGVAINKSHEIFVLDYAENSERPRVYMIPPDGPIRLVATVD